MPTFGARSQRELATLDPRLATVLRAVIRFADFTILKGRRGRAEQNEAVATGASQLEWPKSSHNCAIPDDGIPRSEWREDPQGLSRAVDIAPWPIDWKDERQFAYIAGRIIQEGIGQGVRIRFGGDWDEDGQGNWRDPDNSFNDMPHFELVSE